MKPRWFATKIFEQDKIGIPYEHFASQDRKERWESDFRWTSADNINIAKRNIRAKIKDMLGYSWAEVQKVDMEFTPTTTKAAYIAGIDPEPKIKQQSESELWMNKIWTVKRDTVFLYTIDMKIMKVTEPNLFTIEIPVMDCTLPILLERWTKGKSAWVVMDSITDRNPYCVFTSEENAMALAKLVNRVVMPANIDKSMFSKK